MCGAMCVPCGKWLPAFGDEIVACGERNGDEKKLDLMLIDRLRMGILEDEGGMSGWIEEIESQHDEKQT